MLYLVLSCRDGPAWYGVGLLIRWSYDHPGSNPGPGVYYYLSMSCLCSYSDSNGQACIETAFISGIFKIFFSAL